ncbi:hypothetical protein ACHAXT_001594 [Thalassiosira profunda]
MRSRSLLPALLAVGTAVGAEGVSSKASAGSGGAKSDKSSSAEPYYLFHGCDEEPAYPEGYSTYGDGRRRRDRRRARREAGAAAGPAGRDQAAEDPVGRERALKSKTGKCSKSTSSKSSKKGKSSKSSTWSSSDWTPAPHPPATPAPSPKPTIDPLAPKPTDEQITEACEDVTNGIVPTPMECTESAELTYTYEAAVSSEGTAAGVAGDMENSLALFTASDLLGCDDRRRLLRQEIERMLNGQVVVGVKTEPVDRVTGGECQYMSEIPAGATCNVIEGGMTLCFSSDEVERRKLGKEESTADALDAIMTAMNQDNSPFLESSGPPYGVDGLVGVQYVTGTTNDGAPIPEDPLPPSGGTKPDDEVVQTSRMSAGGAAGIAIGLVALIALAMAMLLVRKRRDAEAYDEFKDVDDDLTDLDDASQGNGKQAYVVGEEGSMYTSATPRFLGQGVEVGNDNDDGHQVDVHHCTSAVCPICQGKETVFVSAIDEGSVDPEGYEFRYTPSEVNGKRSFEYEPKEEMASPTFDNPAEIERPYVVDDTVAF